jgi:hypothetical protein
MSKYGEVVKEILYDTYGVDSDELENICEDIADAVQIKMLKEFNLLNCIGAEYNSKNRPCIDIALAMDIVRGIKYENLTDEEKSREYQIISKN